MNFIIVSIIIPHYNHTKALRRCLDSIVQQTWRDFKIIIVDDGSNATEKESLKKIVASFSQFHGTNHETARFHGPEPGTERFNGPEAGTEQLNGSEAQVAWSHGTDRGTKINLIFAEHRGANAARNRGARQANGKYLLFCDADIVMRPDMLEKMVKTMEVHPEAAYVYSSFRFGWKIFHLWSFDESKLKQNNFIHTTSLLRREYFSGFDEKINRLQDWDFWLTILEHGGQGIWIPEVLFQVISHKHGMSLWLPKFIYKIPWLKLGIHIKTLEDFNLAKKIVLEKHKIYG